MPAGLGVTEGIGAYLAKINGSNPAEAFVALGIDRVFGYVGSIVLVGLIWLFRKQNIRSIRKPFNL